jgi:hypothetical protein
MYQSTMNTMMEIGESLEILVYFYAFPVSFSLNKARQRSRNKSTKGTDLKNIKYKNTPS